MTNPQTPLCQVQRHVLMAHGLVVYRAVCSMPGQASSARMSCSANPVLTQLSELLESCHRCIPGRGKDSARVAV